MRLARDTLAVYLDTGKKPAVQVNDAALHRECGVFVSLHQGNRLRGCIGTFTSSEPLYSTVQEMAISAGTRDPRFAPVRSRELAELDIEISVLSPLHEIDELSEIEVGKHGIYITKGYNRGVLLPQVAVQYGWGRDEFLDNTCLKAGLPADTWRRESITMEIFSAEVFGEKEYGEERETCSS